MTDNKDVNSDIQPSNSIDQQDSATAHSEAKPSSSTPSDKSSMKINHSSSKSGALVVSGLAIAIAAASLGTSGWLYFQSLESKVDTKITQLVSQNSTLHQQIDQLTSQLNKVSDSAQKALSLSTSTQQSHTQNSTKIAENTKQLSVIQSKIDTLNSVSKEDWQLAEAQYLIRLANQRLLLEKDHSNALALLQNADAILADMEDPILFDTRKAIAKDIQALKSVGTFDLEGYYLQLNALYDSVATLPQFEPSKEWQNTENEEQAESSSIPSSVDEIANSFWLSLKSLIVINYDRKPIKALLPPAEYQELVTGIQLQIEVAQVALVKGEKTVYQSALAKIAEAVANYFDIEAKATNAFLTSLTALQQINPDQKLPLPRASLSAIKALMTQWNEATQHRSLSTQDETAPPSSAKQNSGKATQPETGTTPNKSLPDALSPTGTVTPSEAAPKTDDKTAPEGVSA
ncbi:uroporphyrinogen-III C-methyltransferase [Marinomonas balearica]|uniref:Uroporphyrin-3 C-methyltransferase n=1 Tax=Marinomonas balearica TaxID=491947 RepID=A0A4R6M5G1_9GAMM|nr:uroporphyrinogen-III C-methyltransferase [Marinomonas balearica]TDO96484.1 uroporphyrin-3 C-methyltransferase [Marinomonas balearica]